MACPVIPVEKEKPLSSELEILQERDLSPKKKFNTEYSLLELPSLKSWTRINIDLDFAVELCNEIRKQTKLFFKEKDQKKKEAPENEIDAKTIQLSASDFYMIGPLLRILISSQNFKCGTKFELSLKDLTILLFGSNSQRHFKKVKKYLTILDYLILNKFPILTYIKRKGKTPLICFNDEQLVEQLNSCNKKSAENIKHHDYVVLPKNSFLELINRLVKIPTAFGVFLEEIHLVQKQYLELSTPGWIANRIDKSNARLESIFCCNNTCSDAQKVKSVGNDYLKKIFAPNEYRAEICKLAYSCISQDQLAKFRNIKQKHVAENQEKFNKNKGSQYEIEAK